MSGSPTPHGARIRPYEAKRDFEGMFLVSRDMMSRPPYDAARQELAEYPSKQVVARVAETDSEGVIGFCAASFPYWNAIAILDYLVVAPPHRHRGLGGALVAEVEGEIRSAGMRRFCVQTASWNVDAIRFYERQGFVVEARLPRYFGDENDMAWLGRDLC